MKRIIKQDLSITLAVLAIAIFAFFFWMYPYHLFHKEQMMLFLYSGEFLRGYFQEEAWLACLTGDFLTQFFYYIGGGPFILSVVLTLFALLTYRTFRQFVSKRYALPLMILLVLWEAGRSCGLAYPLSATLSLIGAEGVFLLYSRSQTEGQRLLTCIPAMLLCYWCFGYGAWLCLALMLAAGIIAHHQKLSALLAAGILLLPATQYPATTWWSKPDLDREYVLSLDVEHYFGNIQKMRKHLETDRQILWVTYYRNLYNATHPSEINSPVSLSRNLLAWNQPGTNGLILPVNPSASFLSILFANELWFTLGDMTMAEHCAMLSMIFSPRNSGSRMIKRLAEINLVNGDDEAALKYLRILDKTLLHKSWAEKRIPGQQTPQVKEWLEKKRRDIPTQDQLRSGNDAVTSLRNLVASNAGNLRAYEYLLCYHLLSKDLRSFVEDYVPGKVSSPIFAEALLIHLARQGNIRAEELIKYQIPVKIAKEFADYTRLYEAKDTSLKEKYGKTYWFYYHFATTEPGKESKP